MIFLEINQAKVRSPLKCSESENNNNVIAFKAKAGSLYPTQDLEHDDPLHDLLQEFIQEDDDQDNDSEAEKSKISDIVYRDFSTFTSAAELLEHMRDIQKRIHYYVDEIESYMPKHRS